VALAALSQCPSTIGAMHPISSVYKPRRAAALSFQMEPSST
jgi:hypothetical protein